MTLHRHVAEYEPNLAAGYQRLGGQQRVQLLAVRAFEIRKHDHRHWRAGWPERGILSVQELAHPLLRVGALFALRWTHSNWNLTFYVSAAVYLTGIVFWSLLDSVTPLER
jgi:hypothetical protein